MLAMNLGLLDPFDLEYPDLLSHSWELQAQEISAFAFNKWGSLLVIGTRNGSIVLFDMDTKAQAQEINVFHKEIIYLSWDRSGRWIAAVSEDARVALFDLKIAEIKLMEDLSKLFPRGIKALHFHPKFLRK